MINKISFNARPTYNNKPVNTPFQRSLSGNKPDTVSFSGKPLELLPQMYSEQEREYYPAKDLEKFYCYYFNSGSDYQRLIPKLQEFMEELKEISDVELPDEHYLTLRLFRYSGSKEPALKIYYNWPDCASRKINDEEIFASTLESFFKEERKVGLFTKKKFTVDMIVEDFKEKHLKPFMKGYGFSQKGDVEAMRKLLGSLVEQSQKSRSDMFEKENYFKIIQKDTIDLKELKNILSSPNVMLDKLLDKQGRSPLHVLAEIDTTDKATLQNVLELMGLCIKRKVGIDAQDNRVNETALFSAYRKKNRVIAEYLLSQRINPNIQNISGNTVFDCACYDGDEEMVKLILLYNPDLTIKDNQGKTGLDYAKEKGYTNIVKLINEYVAYKKSLK